MLTQELISLSGLDEDRAARFVQRAFGLGGEDQLRRDQAKINSLQDQNELLSREVSRLHSTETS